MGFCALGRFPSLWVIAALTEVIGAFPRLKQFDQIADAGMQLGHGALAGPAVAKR